MGFSRAHREAGSVNSELPFRLRGYARWIPQRWRIVVLVDRDNEDYSRLKDRLERMAADAGLSTRTAARAPGQSRSWVVVNRLAIEELESWYFGDWNALQDAGYFPGGLAKIEAARALAAQIDPSRNTSPSFRALRDVLREIADA